MKQFRKLSLLLALVLVFSSLSTAFAIDESFSFDNVVDVMYVGNADTGEAYYKKNEDKIYPIASMSKLMSYLIVMDSIKSGKISLEDEVTIDEEAARLNDPEYSNFGTKKGEKIKVKDLLKGMMVVSGNDASVALAKHVAKSEAEFVKLMNDKAKALGLKNSKFVNSTGITELEKDKKTKKMNSMSAKDLFTLAYTTVKEYPEVEEYGKIRVLSYPERGYTGESTLPVTKYDKAMSGLKTGYTEEAGFGYVGLFDMNEIKPGQDFKLLTIVNQSHDKNQRLVTTEELIDFVLENYRYSRIVNEDLAVVDKKDSTTREGYIKLYPEKSIYGVVGNELDSEISYVIDYTKKAPYEDGEELGELNYKINGKEESMKLVNRGYVAKANFFARFWINFKDLFDKIVMLF